ncbi:MAG: Sodium/proline symporter [Myxococcota bacterium]|nr:Sodium/proline symporter [Myxococcota bacterium]
MINWQVVALFGYLAVQLVIGIILSRRAIATEEDYVVGGRSLGYPRASFTIFATWFGAETCIGSSGNVWENGLGNSVAEPFGFTICLLVMAFFFASRLWKLKLTTLADLFRRRYSPVVEKVAVFTFVPASLMWAAGQLLAFGNVLSTITTFTVADAMVLSLAIAVAYTSIGGLLANATIDVMQGITIFIGLFLVLWFVMADAGGVSASLAMIKPEQIHLFPSDYSALEHMERWIIPILGSAVQSELVARVIAARSPVVARGSTMIAAGFYFCAGFMPALVGLITAHTVKHLDRSEQILPTVARDHLHSFFFIIFIGAIVAAILSTINACLLTASSMLAHNVVLPFRKHHVSEKDKVWLVRACLLGCGILALGLAYQNENVYRIVLESSAIGTAGSFTVVAFALYSRIGGNASALASLISGMVFYPFLKWGVPGLAEWGVLPAESSVAAPFLFTLVICAGAYMLTAHITGEWRSKGYEDWKDPSVEPAH